MLLMLGPVCGSCLAGPWVWLVWTCSNAMLLPDPFPPGIAQKLSANGTAVLNTPAREPLSFACHSPSHEKLNPEPTPVLCVGTPATSKVRTLSAPVWLINFATRPLPTVTPRIPTEFCVGA